MTFSPLQLSLTVAVFATLLAVAIAIPVAALLSGRRFFGRDALDAAVTAPLVLPPTVLGYYLLVALGSESVLGRAYAAVFGSTIVFSFVGCVVAAFVGCLPLVVISARSALEEVDPTLVHAARTLGATRWRAFWTVRLPLASRGVLAGAMLAFAKALGDFGATLMIAGDIPGRTQTASLAIYDAIQAGDEGAALRAVVVLTATAVGILYGVNKLTRGRRGR